MPERHILGSGRDRRFELPQYFIDIDGIRTAFADSGAPPGGSAQTPLLFVHGLAGNVSHWVEVAPAFTASRRVLAVDLPGHGETERTPGRYSIDNYVRHVTGLLDSLQIERAHIVGHSMGGMVSLASAISAPDRIASAVLVNPAGMGRLPAWARVGGRFVIRKSVLDRILPRVWKHGILANVFFQKNAQTRAFINTVESTHDMSQAHELVKDISTLMHDLRHDLLERDYATLLGSIGVPIGVIWGEKDRLVPAPLLRDAARRLPNVQVEEIPRCGHMPNIERPERVRAFIEAHLARVARLDAER